MSKYIFQSTGKKFQTQKEFLEYLRAICATADRNSDDAVKNKNHILELKDFICDYYCERDFIISKFDLDNCEFFVALPPNPRNQHKCFWIKQKNVNEKQHFATSRNGLVRPSVFDNFYRFCTDLLIPIKFELRKYFTEQLHLSADNFDLWHKQPKTKELVQEFIDLQKIGDKLEKVISPNGLGNNIPFLMPDYEYLEQEFIDFYQSKVATQLNFELKPRA